MDSDRRFQALALLCGAFPVLAGCGAEEPERIAIRGRVQFAGQPLEAGMIDFVAGDEGTGTNAVIEDGEYSLPPERGLPAGYYTVRITARRGTGEFTNGPGGKEELTEQYLPGCYNTESTLSLTVDGAKSTYDFTLDESCP